MNNKNAEKKLDENLEWLFQQVVMTMKSFAAIEGVSNVVKKTDALGYYGDYIYYTQGVLIDEVCLNLSKIYVENKDSHSFMNAYLFRTT